MMITWKSPIMKLSKALGCTRTSSGKYVLRVIRDIYLIGRVRLGIGEIINPPVVLGSSLREEVYASPRLVVGKAIEVVNGSGMDSVTYLVMLECDEYKKEVVRRGITQGILDEWSFFNFNQSIASNDPVVKDQTVELVAMNRHGDEEPDGETMFPDEIWNEWNFGNKNKYPMFFYSKVDKEFDRSESESSDQIVTWDERKKSDENKLIILQEAVVESKDAMEQSGSLATNESMCSSGVGIFEVIKEGSHDKQPVSKGKEEGANPMEMISESDMGEQ
ncbi:hypothetical protein PIB30_031427 [Stylosanthes scabra]|uniref:Uncharacterized protein n=1 Tax=Stylosanthes scabra TaxID=79078 RepID=A0ABU6RC41_9FABA|nr:hypothetical protein [Stylosanthes scabra]